MRLLEGARQVQLIALSATVGNPRELATWLSTLGTPIELILSDYRPVPLSYAIVVEPRKDLFIRKEVRATLEGGGQVLLFTATRKEAEQQAIALTGICQRFLTPADVQRIREATRLLGKIPGHNLVLTQALLAGVAFHHAGLDKKERMVVETLFNARLIRVICCTTTLAAGINTPARVVILRGSEMKKRARVGDLEEDSSIQSTQWIRITPGGPAFLPFPPNQVFQLLGRAGRPGLDASGRGIILTSSDTQASWAEGYYFSPYASSNINRSSPRPLHPRYAPLHSQLDTPDALRELVLIRLHALGRATLRELQEFFKMSLYSFQQQQHGSGAKSQASLPLGVISFLLSRGFIRRVLRPFSNVPLAFEVTRLGSLTTRLYVPPSKALLILDVLLKSSPVTVSTLLYLGCDLLSGQDSHGESNALMLERWIAEVPVEEVVNRAGKSLGDLAVLNLEVSRYLRIVSRFAEFLTHPEIALLARTLALRVLHGVKEELLGLVKQVPGVGRLRGRLLVNAGVTSPGGIMRESLASLAEKTGISPRILAEIKTQCSLIVADLLKEK